MPNHSSNRGEGKPDLNELAYDTVQRATGQVEKPAAKEKIRRLFHLVV